MQLYHASMRHSPGALDPAFVIILMPPVMRDGLHLLAAIQHHGMVKEIQ
jgi:hypothetical protein